MSIMPYTPPETAIAVRMGSSLFAGTSPTTIPTKREQLPVRLPLAGEIPLMGRFMDDHGDPSEWSQETALEYAAQVAQLRADELNSWKQVAR